MGQPTIFASAQGSCHMDARWCTWKIKHIKGYNQRKKEVHEDIRGFRVSYVVVRQLCFSLYIVLAESKFSSWPRVFILFIGFMMSTTLS